MLLHRSKVMLLVTLDLMLNFIAFHYERHNYKWKCEPGISGKMLFLGQFEIVGFGH